MTVTKLVSLPTELLVNILEYCDTPAIVACILTCSRLKYIVDHTSTLRYVVDLAANGMYDRGSNVSIAHRQQRLEAYLTAWRDLSWSESGSSSDFTGRSWHGLHVFGNILAYQSEKLPGYALTLQRLPSKLRAVNSERWCIETPSWAFQLDIDDAQDLCIYRIPQSPEFHIVTLSSGLAHPSNTTQGLVTLDDDVTLVQHNDLRIHRESFAFVAHDSDKYRSTVFVFDWKHGERLARVEAPYYQDVFDFLDERHILVVHPSGFTVREGAEVIDIYVHDIHSRPDHVAKVDECFHIVYPMPKGQVPNTTPRIELRHNVVRCRPSALPRELGSELFRDCGADRLVALRVATRVNRTLPFHNGVVEFELHIPSRALVALAHSFAFPAVDALTCPFIRVTREQRYTSTSCAVAGMRAIIRQPSLRESDGRWALKISDYHYGRVAKARAITGNTRFASTSPLPFIEAEMVLEEMELPGTVPVCALLEDGVVVFEVDPENRRTIRNTRVYSF